MWWSGREWGRECLVSFFSCKNWLTAGQSYVNKRLFQKLRIQIYYKNNNCRSEAIWKNISEGFLASFKMQGTCLGNDKLRQYFQAPLAPLHPIIQGDVSLISTPSFHYILCNIPPNRTQKGIIQLVYQYIFLCLQLCSMYINNWGVHVNWQNDQAFSF